MKPILFIVGLVLSSLLLIGGCQTETSTSFGLEIEEAALAKKVAGTWDLADEPVFEKGDIVGLVLFNVKGFEKGSDGLNWMDMDVEVTEPSGDVVWQQQNILGDVGHVDLPNNVAESPVGTFSTTPELESGTYTLKVTIKDRVGGGSASKSQSFTLK